MCQIKDTLPFEVAAAAPSIVVPAPSHRRVLLLAQTVDTYRRRDSIPNEHEEDTEEGEIIQY